MNKHIISALEDLSGDINRFLASNDCADDYKADGDTPKLNQLKNMESQIWSQVRELSSKCPARV